MLSNLLIIVGNRNRTRVCQILKPVAQGSGQPETFLRVLQNFFVFNYPLKNRGSYLLLRQFYKLLHTRFNLFYILPVIWLLSLVIKAELGLSVVLQSPLIKEMQKSIDFAAAKALRLRSMTILTPFPEQNVTKFTQRQQQMASVMLSAVIKKLIFRLCWGGISTDTFDKQLLLSLE